MKIVIIGATSGIGKALFEKFANENNRIGIIGRRAHLLDKLYQKYPSKTIPTKADIHYCPVKFHQSESWRSSSGF